MLELISGRREHTLVYVPLFQKPQKGHRSPQKLKTRQLILLPPKGLSPSSHKSIFVYKSPLLYFLKDILLNLGQLTEEFDPNNVLSVSYF